jgi:hypothetical protein
MRALKRQGACALRQGVARGRKVLYVWGMAGIYFLSREKDNMRLQVVGKKAFDPAAPENIGIVADEMVGGGPLAHIAHAADRLTVRTVKFVRWLRNHLDLEILWCGEGVSG